MKKSVGTILVLQVVCMILGMAYIMSAMETGSIRYFVDFPTLILLLLFSLPVLFISGMWKDFLRAFHIGKEDRKYSLCEMRNSLHAVDLVQKQIVYAGIMCMAVQMVIVAVNYDSMESFTGNIAVVFIFLIYIAILQMLIMPMKAYVQKCIENYMGEVE